MGLPGMNGEAAAAYAAAEIEAKKERLERECRVTVAEFRNRLNPITHYYDQRGYVDFFTDETIPLKEKLGALFGKAVSDAIDMDKLGELAEKRLAEKRKEK